MAGEKTAQAAAGGTQKVKRAAQTFFGKNKGLLLPLAILGLLFVIVMVSLGSCSAALSGVGTTIISTTYPSTDEEIYAVEDAYAALEAALNTQINNMESTHPGYDEYNYQIDEISHNPYQLISYFFSAVRGVYLRAGKRGTGRNLPGAVQPCGGCTDGDND